MTLLVCVCVCTTQISRSSLSSASAQTPRVDNKYTYRGISDSRTYYSCTGARLQSPSTIKPQLPHLCSPHLQPRPSESSSSPPDKQTALFFFLAGEMWEEDRRICPLRLKGKSSKQTTGKKKKKNRGSGRKRDSGYLSCSWKCHPGAAINHMGLWCVYLQLGASLPSTLLFSPLALLDTRTHTHTQSFLLDQISPSSTSPFLPPPFTAVSVHLSFCTQKC